MLTKRNHGDDIPEGMTWAVERAVDGQTTVVGYAPTEEAANRYMALAGNDASSVSFFEKKYGQKRFGVSVAEGVPAAAGTALGNQLAEEDPAESRQRMRRADYFRQVFDQFLIDRAQASHGPNILHVTWKEFESMYQEYRQAAAAGEGKDCPFQPLATYVQKLQRTGTGKRPIRPILANEVGVWTNRHGQAKIIMLKDQGPDDVGGKYFQVPGKVGV